MDEFRERLLGKTGLKVGRLGVAASYGAPAEAIEEAFDHGCNYLYYGSGRKRAGMRTAVRNITKKGRRNEMVVAVQTYGRFGFLNEAVLTRTLKAMNLDYADILILGWHNSRPSQMLIDTALKHKEKGLIHHIGVSGHNRSLFPPLAEEEAFDVIQVRYNAAHRGGETETFPLLKTDSRPGVVSYTATRWGHLIDPDKTPADVPTPRASDCYRFSMSNPSVDVCLCGPKNVHQMREALKSLEKGPLSDDEMKWMKQVGDYIHQNSRGFFG